MYKFTEDCYTHITEIDKEHQQLFETLNDAIALTQTTDDVTSITKNLLSHLQQYATTHFAHEEAYMEQTNDPELPLQRREHAAFTKKVTEFTPNTSSAEAARASLQELLEYMVRWLYHHILSSDILIGKMQPEGSTEDPFAFTDKYRTGITLVDDEHAHLFEIIRETNDLIHEEFLHDKYDEIMHLLAELRDYTKQHFSDEEELMKQIDYPGLDAQVRAHTAFVDRLVHLDLSELDEMDNNQQEYLLNLIHFLLDWLSNHILGADKKIGEYIAEHHISLHS